MPVMCVGMSMVECALFPEEGNMASAEAEGRGNVDLGGGCDSATATAVDAR